MGDSPIVQEGRNRHTFLKIEAFRFTIAAFVDDKQLNVTNLPINCPRTIFSNVATLKNILLSTTQEKTFIPRKKASGINKDELLCVY